jgi:chemotaxis protein MotB
MWAALLAGCFFLSGCAGSERTATTAAIAAEDCGRQLAEIRGRYDEQLARVKAEAEAQRQKAGDELTAARKEHEDRLAQARSEATSQHQRVLEELAAAKKDAADRLAQAKAETEASQRKAREEMDALRAALDDQLKDNANRQQVLISQVEGHTLIEVGGDILFASGEADLTPEGETIVRDISAALSRFADYRIRVEGHTDDRPIGPRLKDKFASNWALSGARAAAVVRYMADSLRIEPARIEAVGYGRHRPIAENASKEGRAKNRRVEIVVSKESPKRAPAAADTQ